MGRALKLVGWLVGLLDTKLAYKCRLNATSNCSLPFDNIISWDLSASQPATLAPYLLFQWIDEDSWSEVYSYVSSGLLFCMILSPFSAAKSAESIFTGLEPIKFNQYSVTVDFAWNI